VTSLLAQDLVLLSALKSSAWIRRPLKKPLATPRTICRRPANLFVADFIGSPAINLINGRTARSGEQVVLKAEMFEATTTYRSLAADQDIIAAIRPERIALVTEPGPNTIAGTVRTFLPSGSETVLQVYNRKQLFRVLVTQEVNLAPGQEILLYLPPEHIILFDRDNGRLFPLPE